MLQLEDWEGQYDGLDRLTLSNCPKLKKLPHHFLNLRVLKIKKCESLQALPLTPSLRFLILIDNSVLEDWKAAVMRLRRVSAQGQCLEEFLKPSFQDVIELKIKNCPKMPRLPKLFAPQKLEIIKCPLITTLPNPEYSQRLQHLAVIDCADDSLVKAIPRTSSLYSLVISNISGLSSFPQWPDLPGLKALYIHNCEDLFCLSEGEISLLGFTSLTYLSIRGCPKLMTLTVTGLPNTLEVLSIDSCNILKNLGPSNLLKNLTSLKDLYIENCQDLQSLPDEGLPTSLQHVHIEGCPLLLKECQDNTGKYWQMIMNIPDKEFLFEPCSPKPMKHSKMKSPLSAILCGFTCSKGFEISEIEKPQNLGSVPKDKGKARLELGECSSSAKKKQ